MLVEIVIFLINIIFMLFGSTLLLRAWMRAVRLPPYLSLPQRIFQATDWIVRPLNRLVTTTGTLDSASLLASWLIAFLYMALVMLLTGGTLSLIGALIAALLMVIKWALNL